MKKHFETLKKNLKAGKLVLFLGTLEDFVRTNPSGTYETYEIDRSIDRGAERSGLKLPQPDQTLHASDTDASWTPIDPCARPVAK